jgi:hypothetical protein
MCRSPSTIKDNLIVASEVVNDSSDVGQHHEMASAAKELLDAKALQAGTAEGLVVTFTISYRWPSHEGSGRLHGYQA